MTFTPGQKLIYQLTENHKGRRGEYRQKVYSYPCIFLERAGENMSIVKMPNGTRVKVLNRKVKDESEYLTLADPKGEK